MNATFHSYVSDLKLDCLELIQTLLDRTKSCRESLAEKLERVDKHSEEARDIKSCLHLTLRSIAFLRESEIALRVSIEKSEAGESQSSGIFVIN